MKFFKRLLLKILEIKPIYKIGMFIGRKTNHTLQYRYKKQEGKSEEPMMKLTNWLSPKGKLRLEKSKEK